MSTSKSLLEDLKLMKALGSIDSHARVMDLSNDLRDIMPQPWWKVALKKAPWSLAMLLCTISVFVLAIALIQDGDLGYLSITLGLILTRIAWNTHDALWRYISN